MAEISLFDTHCHIDFHHFDDDRDEVFTRMQDAGVERIVAVSVELEQHDRLARLAESRKNIWFSVGIHPNHETGHEPGVDELCRLSEHPLCVAIGESGMDFFRHRVEPEVQAERFRTHIRAAIAVKKPVIVHMRDADEATLNILAEEGIETCGGIMHCFSSGWDAASRALDMGMSISFSGNVTFKRNEELREVAAKVPGDKLLIETDAPYLAPMPYRGKRNEPTYVRQVAECIADVRGISLPELARLTTGNALARFNI
ncbi:MAG TPA: TatD family hydrolase [Mariprofundaceae bacterium]|nr:TatD family hydrolase [Mariprofundaceae bacterium]